jgi:hypothetical protein
MAEQARLAVSARSENAAAAGFSPALHDNASSLEPFATHPVRTPFDAALTRVPCLSNFA